MKQRRLGKNGPLVTEQGLGCMGMSEFYGPRNDEESVNVIHRALDLGVNFLDTSDMYGQGHNEELLGRALLGKRKQVMLATKFGYVRNEKGEVTGVCGKPDYVQKACEASLKRLSTDVVDLYYYHRVDTSVPIEETVGAMSRLIEQGKVRYLGLSEAAAETIRRGHAVHPITALQSEYSLWERGVEKEILPTCRKLGIGFVSYSPLGRGFLTGRITNMDELTPGDNRRNFPRFQGENFETNREWFMEIEGLAAQKKCTSGQLALAWVLAQGEDIVTIPGTKRIAYLEENLGAENIVLDREDLMRIDQARPEGVVKGTRYPERGMQVVER
ncbi:aldo/keto reductase [candidate division KSB1 bacterium]|nr:MAG: aldo/keto reductase [candidate division KSB1 bacterium]